MVCAFFHELGHVHCYRNDLFYNYHHDVYDDKASEKVRLKVERWVARFGERLYSQMGMESTYGKYHDGYLHHSPDVLRKWLSENQ